MSAAKNVSLFLALRYLRPKQTFVSVITIISILGVTLGVLVLVVVIAVMAGFEEKIKESVLGFEPHIEIMPSHINPNDPNEPEPGWDWEEVSERVKQVDGVKASFPYLEGLVFLDSGGEPTAAGVRAVRHEDRDVMPKLGEMADGNFNLSNADLADDVEGRIVIGRSIAERLGGPGMRPGSLALKAGTPVTAYSPSNVGELVEAVREMEERPEDERGGVMDEIDSLVLPYSLEVSGIFEGNFQYDQLVLMPLDIAQEVFETRVGVHGLGVVTDDPYRAEEVKIALLEFLPPNWYARTWGEKHEIWFKTIRNERDMMFMVLFFIVLVAAFCTMNTMITVAVQKRREIGIITALGTKVSQVTWVFVAQGMVVGVFGALSGVISGLLVVFFRNHIRAGIAKLTGREIFASEIYGISEIPAKIVWIDVALIAGGAFLLCALAALIPAYMAARTDPAKALRGD